MQEIQLIEARELYKAFGQQKAVNGLSFGIHQGETFGFLGPNGAGKTTTIAMLVGLLAPDSGEVTVRGRNPMRTESRRSIGVAPQSLSLYDELTASENLDFFGSLYGLAGAKLKERVDWCLDFAELKDRRKHRVGSFSGGMKRRMNIAVALIHQPEILFLDEPTVGVDPHSRNHIFECIQKLKDQGMTVLYTTHYMEEAQRLCDRVAIVDHGKLLALDTVQNLIMQHGDHSVVTGELNFCPEGLEFPGLGDSSSFRFKSHQPLKTVADLTGKGVEFQTLGIAQPDLECVFLALTGRSLRDQ